MIRKPRVWFLGNTDFPVASETTANTIPDLTRGAANNRSVDTTTG